MKYQIIITADSPAELAAIAQRLEGAEAVVPYVAPAAFVNEPQLVAPIVPPPVEVNPFAPPAAVVVPPVPNAPAATVVTAPVSAPVQPAPTVASPTPVGVELDPRGFPWDARIHSSSKARVVKGNLWKYARNTPQELIDQVEAELRAQGFGNGPNTAVAASAPVVAAAQASTPAPAQLPPAPLAAPAPLVAGITSHSVVERFTKYLADPTKPEGKPGEKAEWVKGTINFYGFENIMALHDGTQEQLKTVNDYLDSIGL